MGDGGKNRGTPALPVGPVQMLVLGLADDGSTGPIVAELECLQGAIVHGVGAVRLLDVLLVRKDEDGELETHPVERPADDEPHERGALIEALVGAAAGGDHTPDLDDEAVWYLSDAVPVGSAAVIALIEHRWAIPLRDRIAEAGGFALADEWVHPADLVAAGVAARREAGTRGH